MLQAKLLKVKLLLAAKDYSTAISEAGYILKEDENNLEALLLRGRAYYYLADHDVAQRFLNILAVMYLQCNLFKIEIHIHDICYLQALSERTSLRSRAQ